MVFLLVQTLFILQPIDLSSINGVDLESGIKAAGFIRLEEFSENIFLPLSCLFLYIINFLLILITFQMDSESASNKNSQNEDQMREDISEEGFLRVISSEQSIDCSEPQVKHFVRVQKILIL